MKNCRKNTIYRTWREWDKTILNFKKEDSWRDTIKLLVRMQISNNIYAKNRIITRKGREKMRLTIIRTGPPVEPVREPIHGSTDPITVLRLNWRVHCSTLLLHQDTFLRCPFFFFSKKLRTLPKKLLLCNRNQHYKATSSPWANHCLEARTL